MTRIETSRNSTSTGLTSHGARQCTNKNLSDSLHSLYRGKQIIDDALTEETAGYVTDFLNARLDDTRGAIGKKAYGEYIRFRRRLFVYRCTLVNAGFTPPEQPPNPSGLFSKDIRELMSASRDTEQYVSFLDDSRGQMPWGRGRKLRARIRAVDQNAGIQRLRSGLRPETDTSRAELGRLSPERIASNLRKHPRLGHDQERESLARLEFRRGLRRGHSQASQRGKACHCRSATRGFPT